MQLKESQKGDTYMYIYILHILHICINGKKTVKD